jgi:hypothetical protein
MYATELATEQTADKKCEVLVVANLVWLERKLEEIGDPCTPDQRCKAKQFRILLDNQKRKLNALRQGERYSWCDA